MSEPSKIWTGDQVRTWLERRMAAAKLDQAAADRAGYASRDDYDKAAAEEWACRTLSLGDCTTTQAAFAARIKALIGQDDYRVAGINDDERFERHVRAYLRQVAKMTKDNAGFENVRRFR